ncbi:MAG: carbon monoxide dehydrogenase subunit G [Verrucomicrobia bacterium]|nr:carbon monoxide dehydrogenase subunit G [Verrucomicrobiota bacterium]
MIDGSGKSCYCSRDMNIQGSHLIAAPPSRVFEQLVDPAILQQAITGCEKMEKTGEDEYNAHLKIGLASVKGNYVGKVRVTDKQPPHKFTLNLEGKGGPGFVKGTTRVELAARGPGTELRYTADVQVGGLIAAVGSRVIEAAAKKLAGEFFQRFSALVQEKK